MCIFIFHMLVKRPIKKCRVSRIYRLTWCLHVPRPRLLVNSHLKLSGSDNLKTIVRGHYASLVPKE